MARKWDKKGFWNLTTPTPPIVGVRKKVLANKKENTSQQDKLIRKGHKIKMNSK